MLRFETKLLPTHNIGPLYRYRIRICNIFPIYVCMSVANMRICRIQNDINPDTGVLPTFCVVWYICVSSAFVISYMLNTPTWLGYMVLAWLISDWRAFQSFDERLRYPKSGTTLLIANYLSARQKYWKHDTYQITVVIPTNFSTLLAFL